MVEIFGRYSHTHPLWHVYVLCPPLCCVLHDTGKVRLLIICVYMPCDDTSSDSAATYAEMISKLSEISKKYDVHSVIIGGDFNTSFMRKKIKKTLKC